MVARFFTLSLIILYGEVLGLKWGAVDFDGNTITIKRTVTKSGNVLRMVDATKNDSSYAVIPLPELIKDELKKWQSKQAQNKSLQPNDYVNSDYICTHTDGRLFSPNFASHHFALLLANSNMPPIRFHDLRHSSANYLKFLGFDLKDIQVWLRHKDIQTTMNIYACVKLELTPFSNYFIEIFECAPNAFLNNLPKQSLHAVNYKRKCCKTASLPCS